MSACSAGVSFLKNAATGFVSGPRSSSSSLNGCSLALANTGFLSSSSTVTSGGPVILPSTPDGKMRRSVSSNSASVSPGKPTITSEVSTMSVMTDRA